MSLLSDATAVVTLPSLRVLFSRVAEEACAGRHGLLLTGGWLPEDVVRTGVLGALYQAGPAVREVRLPPLAAVADAPAALSALCEVPREALTPGGAGDARRTAMPEVLWLEGLEALDDVGARTWLAYVAAAARFGLSGPHVLLLPAGRLAPHLEVPATSPRLVVHRLGGAPSALEVRLLCRLAETHPADSPESLWREAVLPALVGADVALGEAMWDAVLEDEAALYTALAKEARARAWCPAALTAAKEALRTGAGGAREAARDAAAARWARLGQAGLGGATPEYGTEVGLAALAALEETRAVSHRLWRGEAALLLPRLDELRLWVAEALTHQHGPGWPLRWGRFDDLDDRRRVEKDPLSTEYGPLEHILRKREVGGSRFLAAVSLARNLRNELAHYRPVSFEHFKRLCELEAALR